jgi:predicted secreted protein
MSKMTDADREQRLARFRCILAEVEALREQGALTKEIYQQYWREAKDALGEGQEAEAIESLGFLASDINWLPSWYNDLFLDD